ncbi:MAG: DNA translocase FtsK 4TM domain-containing protein, partial [Pseudomonadota bacterium]
MSFEYHDSHPDRFLPEPLQDRLLGFLTRVGGLCVLAAISATWLSLLTWSATDPSLTHATPEPAINILGYPGAVVSDLMLQSFGVACVVLLLVPTFWALELVLGRQILNLGSKLTYFPFSLLMLAGALSSLPTAGAAGWPLHHGFGGIIGDAVYRLIANLAGMLVNENAAWATGLVLFAVAFASIATAIGVAWQDFLSGVSRRSSASDDLSSDGNAAYGGGGQNVRSEPKPDFNLGREVPRRWHDDEVDETYREFEDTTDATDAAPAIRPEALAQDPSDPLPTAPATADHLRARDRDDAPFSRNAPQFLRQPLPPQTNASGRPPAPGPMHPVSRQNMAPAVGAQLYPHASAHPQKGRPAPQQPRPLFQAQRPVAPQGMMPPPQQQPPSAAPMSRRPEPGPTLKPRFQSLKESLAQHSRNTLVALQPANWPRGAQKITPAAPTADVPHVQRQRVRPFAQGLPEQPRSTEQAIDEDDTFDRDTEAASLAIARRFAPVRVIDDGEGDVDDVAKLKPMRASAEVAQSDAHLDDADLGNPVEADAALDALQEPEKVAQIANSPLLRGMKFNAKRGYQRPSLNLLTQGLPRGANAVLNDPDLKANAELLTQVLNDFGVKGEVRGIEPGPVVTLYQFEPARGIKSSRVIGLSDDIARSMSALSARVAVIPGRNLIGVELPNSQRQVVLLRDLLEAEAYRTIEGGLPLVLGKSISGHPVVEDLASMPHLLVAGTTGSGKSVGVNAMILSLLYRFSPDQLRLLMIDPKMLELSVYNDIPHLLAPVVTEPEKAVGALNWVVNEMEERYKQMAQLSVRNIEVFNNRVRNAKKRGETIARMVQTGFDTGTGQPLFEKQPLDMDLMPRIVVVIDEFADLMMVAGKEVEGSVQRLAQMARAAGIHLIMSTQRPSVDVITGTIKANFPTRISFKVASKVDSRTILNEQGAEQLLGQGDMLFSAGGGSSRRLHGPYVADEEVEAIADALRAGGPPR